MNIEIGKQIRSLRQEKGVTQEELASYLQISCQAVSKWENGTSSPDISLLPGLSVYFGVTIDHLFKLPEVEQLERIENMFMNERTLDKEIFESTEKYLLGILEKNGKDTRVINLLSELYNHRAKNDHEKAKLFAQRGLAINPEMRALHVNFIEALNGITGDGYIDNNRELIQFYKDFLKVNSQYYKGYSILIENLIADKRYDEAQKYIDEARKEKDRYCYYVFEGDIQLGYGNKKEALKIWYQVVEDYPSIWQTYCCLADRLLSLGAVEEAIKYYRKCFDVQEKPRICDGLLSLVQIYEDKKDYNNAIKCWEEVIDMYKEDYNITSGELIDEPKRNIDRLRKK